MQTARNALVEQYKATLAIDAKQASEMLALIRGQRATEDGFWRLAREPIPSTDAEWVGFAQKYHVPESQIRELLFRREYDKLLAEVKRDRPELDPVNQLDPKELEQVFCDCKELAGLLKTLSYAQTADVACSAANRLLDLITVRNELKPKSNGLTQKPSDLVGCLLWQLIGFVRYAQSELVRANPNKQWAETHVSAKIVQVVDQLEVRLAHRLRKRRVTNDIGEKESKSPTPELRFALDLKAKFDSHRKSKPADFKGRLNQHRKHSIEYMVAWTLDVDVDEKKLPPRLDELEVDTYGLSIVAVRRLLEPCELRRLLKSKAATQQRKNRSQADLQRQTLSQK